MSIAVTFTISEAAYDRIRQAAEVAAQPIEEVLRRRIEESFTAPLPTLPPDEEAELAALKLLSDDALWTIAAEQMPHIQQERQSELLNRNVRGQLTDAEQAELDELLRRGDRLMVRKAEAAALLTERGYKVMPHDLAVPHEQ